MFAIVFETKTSAFAHFLRCFCRGDATKAKQSKAKQSQTMAHDINDVDFGDESISFDFYRWQI